MQEHLTMISDFLSAAGMCFVATVSNGKPKVRPFQFQFAQDGKLWFCTGRSKAVYKQLQANPTVQICAVKPDTSTLRVDAIVHFADDHAVKERILQEQPPIKGIYGSVDNPDFTLFFVEKGDYAIFDLLGNPPLAGVF